MYINTRTAREGRPADGVPGAVPPRPRPPLPAAPEGPFARLSTTIRSLRYRTPAHITTTSDDGPTPHHTTPQARPIAWEYDHALRLYPLPDVLILADNSYSFTHEYFGCQVRRRMPYVD